MFFENQYNILEAGNGNEAWELLQKESPELIISDVMMPDIWMALSYVN